MRYLIVAKIVIDTDVIDEDNYEGDEDGGYTDTDGSMSLEALAAFFDDMMSAVGDGDFPPDGPEEEILSETSILWAGPVDDRPNEIKHLELQLLKKES